MNLVLPRPEFLGLLRQECTDAGAVLLFDEVMTGFRVGARCAQGLYGISPDLTTLGKVIGGGLPVAAFGGRAEIMERLAPNGPVYQAGTLSGNPVALAAGLVTIKLTQTEGFFEKLNDFTHAFAEGLTRAANEAGVELSAQTVGGMFGFYFRRDPPSNLTEVRQCDIPLFTRFYHGMLERGFYFAPSAFEAGFVSSAHSLAHIEQTVAAALDVFRDLGRRR
jgi:glutamate-1-semialdehyde 2,1-aminomutase